MSAAGSSIFTDADGYQASLRDLLDLLVLHPHSFHAHLTWVDLPHVRLLRAQELSARVGYLRLPPGEVFVFFVTRQGVPPVHGGLELQLGDLIWQSHNCHQRMAEGSQWGSIAVTGDTLNYFGRSIAGKELQSPSWPQSIRPASADSRNLLRLHGQAARIAETSPNRIMHPEVVRALDQDLIALLVSCLASADARSSNPAKETSARVCVQFEQLLSTEPFRLLSTREPGARSIGTDSESKLSEGAGNGTRTVPAAEAPQAGAWRTHACWCRTREGGEDHGTLQVC